MELMQESQKRERDGLQQKIIQLERQLGTKASAIQSIPSSVHESGQSVRM